MNLTPEIIAAIPHGKTLTVESGLRLFRRQAIVQWQVKYRSPTACKKGATTIKLGTYPEMDLDAARQAAVKLRGEPQPKAKPKHQSIAAAVQTALQPAVPPFGDMAKRWFTFWSPGQRAATLKARTGYLAKLVSFNDRPVNGITDTDCLTLLESIAAGSGIPTAERVLTTLKDVFQFARRPGAQYIERNPCAETTQWLPKAPKNNGYPFIKDPDQFGVLAERVEFWGSEKAQARHGLGVKHALRLLMHTCVRQGELRQATWSEFKDLDKPELARWEIPEEHMKEHKAHTVPLSRQAVACLADQAALLGSTAPHKYVFPAASNTGPRSKGHMTSNTLNYALECMGYKGLHCPHGFRKSFASLAGDAGKDPVLIDMCIAHAVGGSVSRIYNQAERLTARRELMNWWSDAIETMQGC